MTTNDALPGQMVETIVREVTPEAIILFGSRARGDARTDSDFDLLVVETEPFSPRRSREEFDRWKDSLNHVAGRVYSEGKVLYERISAK